MQSKEDLDSKIRVKVAPKKQYLFPFLHMDFYQEYFNVTQRDISIRLRCALLPLKPEFLMVVGKNPDLWGPIWIPTTIIFILFAGGNFANYLVSSDKEHFHYQFDFVYIAVLTIYSMAYIVPVILATIFRFIGSKISYFDMICLYGYSMTIYVPMLILCVIPSKEFQWVLIIAGLAESTAFLIVNLLDEIRLQKKNSLMIIPILIFNIVLLLIFKFYFFGMVYKN